MKLPILAGSFSLAWCDDIWAWRVRIYFHIIAASAVIPHRLWLCCCLALAAVCPSALSCHAGCLYCHLCFFLRSTPAVLTTSWYPQCPQLLRWSQAISLLNVKKQNRESHNPHICSGPPESKERNQALTLTRKGQ